MPIIDAVQKHAHNMPQKLCFNIDGQSMNYATLFNRASRFRQALKTLKRQNCECHGLSEEGRLVLAILPNHFHFAEIFTGASASPHCIALLSTQTPKIQMREVLTRLKPDLVICEKDHTQIASLALEKAHNVLFLDETNHPNHSYERFLENQYDDKCIENLPDHPFFIGFTSGTTGMPKAFIRTRNSWRYSLQRGQDVFNLKKQQNCLAPGPLVHGVSLYAMAEAFFMGQRFYSTQKFKPKNIAKLLTNCDRFIGVPTMLSLLSNASELKKTVFPRLSQFMSGAAKFDKDHFKQAKKFFPNAKILQYYGASELSFVSINTLTEEKLSRNTSMSSVGKPFPGVKITIRDDKNILCPNGTIGTIFVDSDLVASHYLWGDTHQSFRKIAEGASVGDLGMLDNEDNLHILGRQGTMMISAGNNIYFSEIEDAIKQIDDIHDVIAFGQKDALYGEKLVIVISLKTDKSYSANEIHTACRAFLPQYKWPKDIYQISQWPMTWSDKIAREQVKQLVEKNSKVLRKL
ncbi:AMP-binding protein [Bartonella tamiae]|uniref:AMP-dependent synthetase/ligase domain-containing protein n=1 Tax=Bartonella tamiae Th239 TaxID=1094558 RepID=J0QYM4_9HYPH|nr:AMP-binding protein [Bartonella tamiae]EJF91211.1 hypothetical protein ME5_00543 [Bartonella tamiae Th239]EJF93124.1 hypothetical protein MEG_01338 [Bartonella tamiae Th307]